MRKGLWLLAVCGIVGLVFHVGTADDRFLENNSTWFGQPSPSGTVQYFSRSGNEGTQASMAAEAEPDDPESLATPRRVVPEPAADMTDGQRPSRYTRRTELLGPNRQAGGVIPVPGIKNYHRDLFGSESSYPKTELVAPMGHPMGPHHPAMAQPYPATAETQNTANVSGGNLEEMVAPDPGTSAPAMPLPPAVGMSDVIHAEHMRPAGTSEVGIIEQIRSGVDNRNPFRTPSELMSGQKPATTRDVVAGKPAAGPGSLQTKASPARASASAEPRMSAGLSSAGPSSQSEQSGPRTPMITLDWVKHGDINVGQESLCELLVRNAGSVHATDVVIDAYFPSSVRLTAVDPLPSEQGEHVSWKFSELPAGEERAIQIRMIPSSSGELATTAYVRFTGTASERFTVQEPQLKISLSGPKEVMLGDPASQTVLLTNPGTGPARNVTIEALIPKGLEHPRGQQLAIQVGALNPGETRAVRLPLAAIAGGEQMLRIEAKADATPTQKLSHTVRVMAPSIRLTLDGPSLRYVGRKATYVLKVANEGAAPSNNLRVLHKVPEGFQFVGADKGGSFDASSSTASWFIGRLEPGASVELHLVLSAVKLGSYVHLAGAVSEHGTGTKAEFKTVVDGTASLVLEVVDLDDPVEIGVETAYEVRVRNEGSKEARNVSVACQLPAGVEFVKALGPVDFATNASAVTFKPLEQLDPGKTAIYRVHVKGRQEGNYRFRARLASDSIQEPLNFDELTKFYAD